MNICTLTIALSGFITPEIQDAAHFWESQLAYEDGQARTVTFHSEQQSWFAGDSNWSSNHKLSVIKFRDKAALVTEATLMWDMLDWEQFTTEQRRLAAVREFGRALGFGSYSWKRVARSRDGLDYYIGPKAIEVFNAEFGQALETIPLASNHSKPGEHWSIREPFVDQHGRKMSEELFALDGGWWISATTLATFRDIGFSVVIPLGRLDITRDGPVWDGYGVLEWTDDFVAGDWQRVDAIRQRGWYRLRGF
jgi:hypothetical protein